MKITFHGAARTVTGSQHLLEVNGYQILLECGLFQGKRKEAFEVNRQGLCNAKEVDALILSHAHIDHSGNIPTLVKRGFKGNIYSTFATRDLAAIMLLDSAKIQENDVIYVNKQRKRQGKKLFEPLYTPEDVLQAFNQFIGVSYHRRMEILPGIFLTFEDAGHMLGSASVILEIEEKETNRNLRLVFSGDIGRPGIPIIRDPHLITEGCDVLIMESTYGDRSHPTHEDLEKSLEQILNETYARGGSILIPAFAVGRTQQIIYTMHKLYNQKKIPMIPVYVDSPLATRATEIYLLHPELYDREMHNFLLEDDDHNPFSFPGLKYTKSTEQSKAINTLEEPAIIVSASGMMESGRILHHLKYRISDPRNTILVTGWQAPYTLGRRILNKEPEVNIFGESYALKAEVKFLASLSGHADREGLLRWVKAMKNLPKKTFLVHGEEESALAFAETLQSELKLPSVIVPQKSQSFEV